MFWYHNMTKHSYNSVRTNPNQLSWEDQPSTYKNYPDSYKKYKLDLDKVEDNFLYHIAGLTAKKSYPSGEYYLRINPSAGALYPNELYFQVRGVEGIDDGVYHYEVSSSSLTLLQSISDSEGLEPYLGYKSAMKGYLFLVSAIYYRSSWKYKNRAFRYCLLDAGHLLGRFFFSDRVVYYFNRMFGFEEREWFLAGCSMAVPVRGKEVSAIEFSLPYIDGSRTFEKNPLIEEVYYETMKITQFKSCKREVKAPKFTYKSKKLQETIFTNGEYLKYGDFGNHAGYLSLEQYSLSAQGAVAFFLTSKAKNYQALYQKAGIIGHRLYIASLYLGIGCSGIGAYYDDEVNAFVENDEMVLYALAIGK